MHACIYLVMYVTIYISIIIRFSLSLAVGKLINVMSSFQLCMHVQYIVYYVMNNLLTAQEYVYQME